MEISEAGKAFIKRRETCVLQLHWDSLGKVFDGGWGHVLTEDEAAEIRQAGGRITQAQADEWFDVDVTVREHALTGALNVAFLEQSVAANILQGLFDALMSWVYNCFSGASASAISNTTLVGYVNEGRLDEACIELMTWNKSGGAFAEGLLKRRGMELLIIARGEYH